MIGYKIVLFILSFMFLCYIGSIKSAIVQNTKKLNYLHSLKNNVIRKTRSVSDHKVNEILVDPTAKHIIPDDEFEIIDPISNTPVNEDEYDKQGIYEIYDPVCHICSKKTMMKIPIIKKDFKIICDKNNSDNENNICTNIVNVEIHTEIIGAEEKPQISYECCPGWKNSSSNCCMKPICSQNCFKGEICALPDICICPAGIICKNDYDINKNTTITKYSNACEKLKPCDHLCLNTETSFICLCKPGFILAPDLHSCTANETIESTEAKDLEQDFNNLNYIRLAKLEKMIENNKNATLDLNKKVQELYNVTLFLNSKINTMEGKILANEKNVEKFMNFANFLRHLPEIVDEKDDK